MIKKWFKPRCVSTLHNKLLACLYSFIVPMSINYNLLSSDGELSNVKEAALSSHSEDLPEDFIEKHNLHQLILEYVVKDRPIKEEGEALAHYDKVKARARWVTQWAKFNRFFRQAAYNSIDPFNKSVRIDRIQVFREYFCVYMQDHTAYYWMHQTEKFRVLSQSPHRPIVFDPIQSAKQFQDYHYVVKNHENTSKVYLAPYSKNTYSVKDIEQIQMEKIAFHNNSLQASRKTYGGRGLWEFEDKYVTRYAYPYVHTLSNVQKFFPFERFPVVDAKTHKLRIDPQNISGPLIYPDKITFPYAGEVKEIETVFSRFFCIIGADDQLYCNKIVYPSSNDKYDFQYQAVMHPIKMKLKNLVCRQYGWAKSPESSYDLCGAINIETGNVVMWTFHEKTFDVTFLPVPDILSKVLKVAISGVEICVLTQAHEVLCWPHDGSNAEPNYRLTEAKSIDLGQPVIDFFVRSGTNSNRLIRICAIAERDRSLICQTRDGKPLTAGVDLGPIRSFTSFGKHVCVVTMQGLLKCFIPEELRYTTKYDTWVKVENMPPQWRDRIRTVSPQQEKVDLAVEYCEVPILPGIFYFFNKSFSPPKMVNNALVHVPSYEEDAVIYQKLLAAELSSTLNPPGTIQSTATAVNALNVTSNHQQHVGRSNIYDSFKKATQSSLTYAIGLFVGGFALIKTTNWGAKNDVTAQQKVKLSEVELENKE